MVPSFRALALMVAHFGAHVRVLTLMLASSALMVASLALMVASLALMVASLALMVASLLGLLPDWSSLFGPFLGYFQIRNAIFVDFEERNTASVDVWVIFGSFSKKERHDLAMPRASSVCVCVCVCVFP